MSFTRFSTVDPVANSVREVTQDKSACVQWATTTNGGEPLTRVRPVTGASRCSGWIIGQSYDLERVGFVQTLPDIWRGLSSIPNNHRRSSSAAGGTP